ncbi:hypothetical protein AB0I68_34775 [Streptomyces sp. NPDC050448]|uniref:hypothetical protein n=1 Tax=Streptomyces sp. NPDC050448 TaxID=3155404 RepID=UPI0034413E1A
MRDGYVYEPGRSRWTTATGWLMVISALGAIGCALARFPPVAPLRAELALAGAAAFFAGCWAVASYLARLGPLEKRPTAEPGEPSRVLPWIFAAAVPLGTAAALLLVLTGSSEHARHLEQLEQAGYSSHEAVVVRLTGEPECEPATSDVPEHCSTDLVLRIPYDTGTQDVEMKAHRTREAPEPGWELTVYYAAGHPEFGVGTESPTDQTPLWLLIVLAVAVVPWFIIPIFIVKSQTDPERLHALRRFRPGIHLPALAILLTGVVLLLPTALEFEVAGFHRLPAAVAALAPALAMRSVVRRSRRLRT